MKKDPGTFQWCPVTEQEAADTETQEILFKHQEILIYYEGDQALAQVPQWDSGDTLSADLQNLSKYRPWQTDVGGGPAWTHVSSHLTMGLDEMTSRGVFQLNLSVLLILYTGLETNNPYKYTSIIQKYQEENIDRTELKKGTLSEFDLCHM